MITPRLECILNHITQPSIADIGTDHAYIPIKLAQKGRITKAIASDIQIGPVEIARANVEKYKLDRIIEVRMGSGLKTISAGEVDEIIIAGMGGVLISQILEDDMHIAKSAKKLILQPMNAQDHLRKFLQSNGFNIISEDLAIEREKVYNVLEAEVGECKRYESESEYHIPPMLYNHKYIYNLIEKKKREFTKVYNGLKISSVYNIEETEKYKNLLNELDNLERKIKK